jgi:DUF1365 family protein
VTPSLYHGLVRHIRHQPVRHRFAYRVFSCLLDLDELLVIDRRLRLFSYNRFGLFSFFDRDHGKRDGSALRPWIETLMVQKGIKETIGAIRILCFPRILGFVFNPLSIFWIHDQSGSLIAIVYEVKNTFGDQHCYVHAVSPQANAPITHSRDKVFFVSPFIDMKAQYRFRVRPPGDDLSILIRELDGQHQELLTATLVGTREGMTDKSLAAAFFRYPLMTVKVVLAIHWEAFRLWRKGVRFLGYSAPPPKDVSY